MSFPTIPSITPSISLNRNDVINLLLASIAFEELGLAHIINAEAEKIQYVLGTIPGQIPPLEPPTLANLISINRSAGRILKTVIKNQMLLQFKLEDLLELPPAQPSITVFVDTATVTANFEGLILTDSDSAYYHTIQQ
ncbi:MAG: hypothetical protein ABFD08_13775 [Syntrophomonas sp.]